MLVSATLTASIVLTGSGFGPKDSESKTLENMEILTLIRSES
ncbi:hypothetical protein J2Z31_004341 [Sinorhizobium kostiense]|uniref:Uncharacterized protein n=1 Tax=Sinorhizobium kostiense TaxID=76747 RepID=A0ABS4R4J7_9HYPH|nr:hypothetical protein [Sinorhizobium kostiense]